MGVCQSTFGMWFLNADIIIHPMATWLFHNDSAGSTLISVGGFGEGCADPPFTPVLWLHARPQFLKTPSQRNRIMVFHGFVRNSVCEECKDPRALSDIRWIMATVECTGVNLWNRFASILEAPILFRINFQVKAVVESESQQESEKTQGFSGKTD